MIRRLPVFATVIVALAVAAMVALGFWQLRRLDEKERLLARYAQSQSMSAAVQWPRSSEEFADALYRHSQIVCARVLTIDARAGRSAAGDPGWAHQAECALPGGEKAEVALGWSAVPTSPAWSGGMVRGFVGPAGKDTIKLVAAPAQAGLAQLAPPDPREVPNNHLAYAIQWFLFALTAVVIYALALRKKWRD